MVCCPQQILVQLVHGDLVSWCNSWNQIWGAKIVEINNSFHLHQLHKPLVLLTATLHSDGRGRMWWWQNQVRLVQTWCIWSCDHCSKCWQSLSLYHSHNYIGPQKRQIRSTFHPDSIQIPPALCRISAKRQGSWDEGMKGWSLDAELFNGSSPWFSVIQQVAVVLFAEFKMFKFCRIS